MSKWNDTLKFVAAVLCLTSRAPVWSQETDVGSPPNAASSAVAGSDNREADEDIPFTVLQQIVSGINYDGPIKSDLSQSQIDEMKRVQGAHYQKNSRLNQLSSFLSTSRWNNPRFSHAIGILKAESDAELKKEWLSHITSEQRKAIRRRNRAAIVRAVSSQQMSHQTTLLSNDKPLDVLMSDNDMMSVIERPAIQDHLELSEEQFEKLEQLNSEAEADALITLRQMLKSPMENEWKDNRFESPGVAFQKLNTDTLEVLSKEQAVEYQRLKTDFAAAQKLLAESGETDPQAAFKMMMPHGMPTRTSISVKDGKAVCDADFNNAFAPAVMIKALKLTEEQQTKIADLLKNSREDLLSEMAARTEAWNKWQADQTAKMSQPLQVHKEKFHAKAISLLTPSQMEQLEKERLKGLGLLALKKPHVCQALELTEDQQRAIDEIAGRVPKLLEIHGPAPGGDFQKESEAFFKRSRENNELMQQHSRKQNEDLQKVLSKSQQAKFTEMTGYVFVATPSI